MKYYPVCLDVSGKKCVVVGGGDVAERKARRLLDCGARVLVVCRAAGPALGDLHRQGRLALVEADYGPEFLDGAFLAIGATDRPEVNDAVWRDSRGKGILVNIVDDPGRCDFILPSLYRQGDLLIAITTSGKSPALAKKLRKEMTRHFGPEYEEFLNVLGQIREKIIARGGPPERNKALFEAVVYSDVIDHIRAKDWDRVRETVRNLTGEEIEAGT